MRTKKTATLTALAVLPLALALMTGCSSTPPAGGDGTPPTSSGKTYTDMKEWQLAYATCMRDEGIDMPDPDADGRVQASKVEDMEVYEAASDTCIGKIGDAPVDPGTQKSPAELEEQALKLAQCFRDAGFDMPDPEDPRALTIPGDAPDEVVKKCMPGTTTSTKSVTEG
jgi:hypothetical protein